MTRIKNACEILQRSKTGALIVLLDSQDDEQHFQIGETIDSLVSERLIESIFQKSSPIHDGAIVIHKDRIKYANCFLPIALNSTIDIRLGSRHRAAIGISKVCNATAFVVSETTGEISRAHDGELTLKFTF